MTRVQFFCFQTIYRSAAFFAALLSFPTAALVQDIRITSNNGNMTIEGRFLGYDGEYLRIETVHGELTLDYHGVTCSSLACPNPETHVERIRFSGTRRIGDLILPALVEGYARANALRTERQELGPEYFVYDLFDAGGEAKARLIIQLNSTEEGLAAMQAGDADIAMAARPVRSEDLSDPRTLSSGELSTTRHIRLLAYDAIVPIVSPASPETTISLQDLAQVFSGEITDWSALGRAQGEIELHMSRPDTGLAGFFVEEVLEQTGRQLSVDAIAHATDRDVVAAVMVNPDAIGLVSFERVGNAVAMPLLGSCGLVDAANINSVKTGDYPLTVPLYLYLPAYRLGPIGRDFVDWLSGTEAQRILRRIGVPGETASPITLSEQGDRIVGAIQRAGDELGLGPLLALADMIEKKERLTPTFRFEPGMSSLDPTSLARLRALAQAIADGRYAGRELVLAGFSDGQGPASTNLLLSEARARAAYDAILDALGGAIPPDTDIEVVDLGEVMPVTCDDTIWGQKANRRVELWATDVRYR